MAFVDESDPAAGVGEDRAERQLRGAVHRVDDDLEPGGSDRLDVDELLDVVDIRVGEVALDDDACPAGQVQLDLDHLGLGERIGLVLVAAGLVLHGQRAVAAEDFEAVPNRRVVAGGEDEPVRHPEVRRGEGHQRRRHVLRDQRDGDVVTREDLGRGLGGLARQEAPVEADQNATRLHSPTRDLVGDRLRQPPDVVEGEAFPDDGPPAARPKPDLVLLLGATRPEEPLLQDELGVAQILIGVDPLDLVLVVCPICLDPLAGADQAIDRVGQAVLSRAGHPLEGGEDALGSADICAQVELVDGLLLGGGVRGLDDVADSAVAVAPDAAVGKRPIHDGREQRQVCGLEYVAVEETADRAGPEERGVAVEDQQIALEIGEQRPDLQDGVARAGRVVLHHVCVAVSEMPSDGGLRPADDDIHVLRGGEL